MIFISKLIHFSHENQFIYNILINITINPFRSADLKKKNKQ